MERYRHSIKTADFGPYLGMGPPFWARNLPELLVLVLSHHVARIDIEIEPFLSRFSP
jgi:hypothetical protein